MEIFEDEALLSSPDCYYSYDRFKKIGRCRKMLFGILSYRKTAKNGEQVKLHDLFKKANITYIYQP